MMTKFESYAKHKIQDILNKQGYPTYSKLLDIFDINLTEDPNVIGYMEPGKGRIVLNKGLDFDAVSMVVRHEILHEYLSHAIRAERHVGSDKWNNRSGAEHQAFNKAADWEISNRGYTDADKKTAKSLKVNDIVRQGLVTDIDHPEWINWSMEEMYDALIKEMEDNKQDAQDNMTQIGDKGDAATQAAEDAKRAAQSAIEKANDTLNDPNSSDEVKQRAAETKSKAEKLKDAIEKSEKSIEDIMSGEGSEIFERDKGEDIDAEKARIDKIKKILKDPSTLDKLVGEVDSIKSKDELTKAARDAAAFKNNPLIKFVDSINRFIKDEVAIGRNRSYSKINKTYANTSIIRPGMSRKASNKVPSINVYFDTSASWNEAKINIGKRAVASLNKYVNQGKLKINIWYFSTKIHSTIEESTGGTAGQPILDHIEKTKPDNVIVMTDSDITDCGTDVSVPGAVWFLFVGGVSQNLKEHLRGVKETKSFEIDT